MPTASFHVFSGTGNTLRAASLLGERLFFIAFIFNTISQQFIP